MAAAAKLYLIISVAVSFLTNVTGQILEPEINGINFHTLVPNIMSVSDQTGLGIMHMELDMFVPGNILYIDSHSLKTLNLTSLASSLIAGTTDYYGYREGYGDEARFNRPYSFYQQNSTYVIIVDGFNFCIRSLSRLTNITSWVAGRCTEYGRPIDDGSFESARFGYLQKIVKVPLDDGREIALVNSFTEYLYGKVRIIYFDDRLVTTLDTWWRRLYGLTLRPGTTYAYFSFSGGFGKIDYTSGADYYIATSARHGWAYTDGHFDNAELGEFPETLLFINKDTILITDYGYDVLRVANLNSEYVTSICRQSGTARPGNINQCRLAGPRSLLALPESDRILIGSRSSLGYLLISQGQLETTVTATASGITATPITTAQTTKGDVDNIQSTSSSSPVETTQPTSIKPENNNADGDTISMTTHYVIIIVGIAVVVLVTVATVVACMVHRRRKPTAKACDLANGPYQDVELDHAQHPCNLDDSDDHLYHEIPEHTSTRRGRSDEPEVVQSRPSLPRRNGDTDRAKGGPSFVVVGAEVAPPVPCLSGKTNNNNPAYVDNPIVSYHTTPMQSDLSNPEGAESPRSSTIGTYIHNAKVGPSSVVVAPPPPCLSCKTSNNNPAYVDNPTVSYHTTSRQSDLSNPASTASPCPSILGTYIHNAEVTSDGTVLRPEPAPRKLNNSSTPESEVSTSVPTNPQHAPRTCTITPEIAQTEVTGDGTA